MTLLGDMRPCVVSIATDLSDVTKEGLHQLLDAIGCVQVRNDDKIHPNSILKWSLKCLKQPYFNISITLLTLSIPEVSYCAARLHIGRSY